MSRRKRKPETAVSNDTPSVYDPNQEFDFTSVETPRFRYKVKDELKGTIDTHALDMDAAIMDIRLRLPTLFKPTSETDSESGLPMLGFQKFGTCVQAGEPIPEYLPTLEHFKMSIQKVFRLPESSGIILCFQLFNAFLKAWNQRTQAKKGGPASPASPEATPDLSKSGG